jgi:hypothetical protein
LGARHRSPHRAVAAFIKASHGEVTEAKRRMTASPCGNGRTPGATPGDVCIKHAPFDHSHLSNRVALPMHYSAFETVNEFFEFDAISLQRGVA